MTHQHDFRHFATGQQALPRFGRAGNGVGVEVAHVVNQALFPNDTVQSRLPDPEWLEDWLTHKIRFTAEWESRVVGGILRNLSSLFERPFESVQQLNRYRKELVAATA